MFRQAQACAILSFIQSNVLNGVEDCYYFSVNGHHPKTYPQSFDHPFALSYCDVVFFSPLTFASFLFLCVASPLCSYPSPYSSFLIVNKARFRVLSAVSFTGLMDGIGGRPGKYYPQWPAVSLMP